jgi:hypothetical protein
MIAYPLERQTMPAALARARRWQSAEERVQARPIIRSFGVAIGYPLGLNCLAGWSNGHFFRRTEMGKNVQAAKPRGRKPRLLSVLFWLWGIIGLLFNAGSLSGLTGSIGVGTSAYLAATSLIWIGGMVLFGVGALLSHSDFDGERPMPANAGDVRITK